MFNRLKKRLPGNQGAATIEALGTVSVLLLSLLLALVVGVSFYNTSVLNSAAQNITLNTQVQIDRWCSPQSTSASCSSTGISRANLMRAAVVQRAEEELAYSGPIQSLVNGAVCDGEGSGIPCSSATASLNLTRPQASAVAWPTSTTPTNGVGVAQMGRGWGYNTVELRSQQTLLGGGPGQLLPGLGGGITVGARSMTTSYEDPGA